MPQTPTEWGLIGFVVAALVYVLVRQVDSRFKQLDDTQKRQVEEFKADRQVLVQVVKENTVANTKLIGTVEQHGKVLEAALDCIQEMRIQLAGRNHEGGRQP